MNSTSNVGISPVLLLAVNQSLTSTTTKNSSPTASPTKMSGTQRANENNRHVSQDVLQELVKTQMLKSQSGNKISLQKEKLSDSSETFGENATSDIDMASVLTTLASQSPILQEPEHSTGFQLKIKSAGDSLIQLPANSVPKQSRGISDSLFKNICTESPSIVTGSVVDYKIPASDAVTNSVKWTQKSADEPMSSSQYYVKVEPHDDLGDESEEIPTKTLRLSNESEPAAGVSDTTSSALNSEVVKTLLKMRLAMQGLQSNVNLNELVEEINQSLSQSSNEANTEAMLNVLTSLAMQNSDGRLKLNSELEAGEDLGNKDASDQNKFIISYDSETGAPQLQGIIVSDGVAQVIDQSGNRLLIQSSDTLDQSAEGEEGIRTGEVEIQSGSSVTVYTDPNSSAAARSPCPVCGDTISGFHYGIFTCESCKGFFKRTVQNKKTFLCHRQGECEVNLENRKKCPACRFAKCLVMGMKLEAIRADRTRGGRSSYSGLPSTDQKVKVNMCGPVPRKKPATPKLVRRSSAGSSFDSPEPSQSGSHLVAVLNNGEVVGEVKPFVPQILTDIMNLESLLCEDDIPPEIGGDKLNMNDPSVFLTFLQLAELKLYKIVRWARNLPYFANISTDDQILLLQNCWCELLTLNMCWKSMQLHNEVIFLHGHSIDEEKAADLGIQEMFQSILALIDHMRRLHLDQYECVAMKVIILICPDMKGLKDADKLGEQQQRISGALETYTNTHYRQSPNKFGELILRLSELSRISYALKGHLVKWMPPNSTSCGLLFELLKGENMKELG